MQFLVNQCYTWEGYHLVQALLEDGHEVTGLHEEDLSEKEMHLSMYLARHAMFSEGLQGKQYDAAIGFFGSAAKRAESNRHVDISYEAAEESMRGNQILLPILYGEWMPRNEEAVIWNDRLIPFQDDYFLQHALPITSVMQTISKLLAAGREMEGYRIYAEEVCPEQEDRSIIAIKRNISDDLKVLHKHYGQYSRFY
ncbi:hypothetical protein SFC66_13500 [Terribacillus saccharophilus]|uniref:hypothetical protein n=1 Tax=Terribacillus saccharophilus TaxID=361277 RepID=UPI0039822858